MRVIDTHQHFWNPDHLPYSWCKDIPGLNRAFLPDDYERAAEGTGIERTIFIECDVNEPHQLEEARFYQELAATRPKIAGIVAGCRPESEDFPSHLEKLRQLPLLKGVRRVLHIAPDDISRSPRFVGNIQLLEHAGLSFDLCVHARQLPLALALVRQCPGVSFILDHCGGPDIRGGNFEAWHDAIEELATLANIVCKISGLPTCAGRERSSANHLRPWVGHILASFGWDRVMWGGDWPVCTLVSTLGDWLTTTKSLVSEAAPSQQEKLFFRNAERIYRLTPL